MPPPPSSKHPRRRAGRAHVFVAWGHLPRFVRNAAISLPTFLLDIGLLFLLVRVAHFDYLVTTAVAFLVTNGLSYFLARWLVFGGTRRGVRVGLVYFLAIAALSAAALIPLMWLSVSVFHIDLIISRLVAAAIVGVGGYMLNLMFNFRVARAQNAVSRG